MNLLIFEEKELQTAKKLVLQGERAEHLRTVLRVTTGSQVRVGQMNGGVGFGVVSFVSEKEVHLNISELGNAPRQPGIDLVLALPRPQSLKKVLQTVATMGVRELVLIASARVEKNYFASPLLQEVNLNSYLRLGMEQGEITWRPKVSIYRNFTQFVGEKLSSLQEEWSHGFVLHPKAPCTLVEAFEKNLALDGYTQTKRSGELPKSRTSESDIFGILVGPEGGWLPKELDVFQGKNLQLAQISKRILRVETAVCAALSQFELLEQLASLREQSLQGNLPVSESIEGSHVEREEQSSFATI